MEFSTKTNNYSFDQFRVDLHEFCNWIPVLSTITNTIAVVQKCLFVQDSDSDQTHEKSHYYAP